MRKELFGDMSAQEIVWEVLGGLSFLAMVVALVFLGLLL